MNTVLFVTGTSTGVGKTVVTAALAATMAAAGRSVGVCKPAQTGVAPAEQGDLAEIERLSGITATIEFARYPDPLAPDTAARRSGAIPLDLDQTASTIAAFANQHDVTLVEGAGGVLVRLGADFTLIELASRLGAPVVVVTAAGLGTLNHSELTVRALERAGVRCAGLIIGSWPEEPDLAAQCNLADLPRVTGAPLVGTIPEGVGAWARPKFLGAAPTWFADDPFGLAFGSRASHIG